jgi:hypothetical protein
MVKPDKREETECEEPEAGPEYWDELMKKRALPDAVEAPGEDPEPFV